MRFLHAAVFSLISGAASADDVLKVSSQDLAVQTHKWDGKTIEVVLSCFYADLADYRCVGRGARVDLTTIEDEKSRAYIEKNCDTISKSDKRACTVTVRFVYESFDTMDTNFGGKLTVIAAKDGVGTVLLKAR